MFRASSGVVEYSNIGMEHLEAREQLATGAPAGEGRHTDITCLVEPRSHTGMEIQQGYLGLFLLRLLPKGITLIHLGLFYINRIRPLFNQTRKKSHSIQRPGVRDRNR